MTSDDLLKRAEAMEQTAAAMRLVAEHGMDNCVVECRDGECQSDEWRHISEPRWSFLVAYRASLKPQPKYVPFTRDDWRQIIGRPIQIGFDYFTVLACQEHKVKFGEFWATYSELSGYTFADTNTPCGKLVEE